MACDQTGWRTCEGDLDRDDVQALLAHHFAEMRADSPPEACHVLPVEALRHESIRFLSLRDTDGTLLGVGALKRLDPAHGEIKSMRTSAHALRRGVGQAMLDRLIALARSEGMERLSLETGNSALFAAANRLYANAGFTRCGPFGGYADTPFTHFFTRTVGPSA